MKTFLSSTYTDLVEHRKAAIDALERLGHQVGRMEIFGARPQEPQDACFAEIESCDFFVGIYAHRYGFIPSGSDFSITELEFEHAKKFNKPIFCFLVDENHAWLPKMIDDEPNKSKLISFKDRINKEFVRDIFTTSDDLAFKIAASLGRYIIAKEQTNNKENPYVTMLRQSGDLVELLERAVRELERITRTDYNQIFLITTSAYSRSLVSVADVIPYHKQRYRLATFAGLLGQASASGKTINASNVRERPSYFQAVIATESEIVVPIFSAGVVIGVMNSESEVKEHYDNKTQHEIEHLASALGELLPLFGWQPSKPESEVPWIKRLPVQP